MSHHSKFSWRTWAVIAPLTMAALALVVFNSATANFANILRHRARAEISISGRIHRTFAHVMDEVLEDMLLMAIAAALFVVFGPALVARPSWLREHDRPWTYYRCIQVCLGLVTISRGASIATRVRNLDTLFQRYGRHDNVPYYKIMYFGGIGQAFYGLLALVLTIVSFFIFDAEERNTFRLSV